MATTHRSSPRVGCPYCKGSGIVSVSKDPDEVADCVCTDPPRRVQLSRRAGWRKPENTVVVARPSRWGNPYKLGGPGGRDGAVDTFRWLLTEGTALAREAHPYPSLGEIRTELAGKNLACWCPPHLRCHADVLLEVANGGRDV